MRYGLTGLLLAAVLTGGLLGCGDDDNPLIVKKPFSMYSDASTPQEVLDDLQLAYRRREIEPYARLLAGDFRFEFLEEDARGLPRDFWVLAEDSLATGRLFKGKDLGGIGADVTGVGINLTFAAPDSATLERLPGEEFQRIRVTNTLLDVSLDDGTTLRVSGDQQLFYFRPGKASLAEDPARWYIVHWRDLGNLNGRSPRPEVEQITWGKIKIFAR